MKYYPSLLSYLFHSRSTQRNVGLLLKFLLVLGSMITIYSIVFHFLMAAEGKEHSWLTGFYWTLVVMSTLGFGDITFQSDAGRAFSILVLLSGVTFLLVLFPFTFIKFFFDPWMEAQSRKRAPRELSPEIQDHVLVTHYDSVTAALIKKLEDHGKRYVLITEELPKALDLYDQGIQVALGNIDDPETYRKMGVDRGALVVATDRDEVNTNIVLTVREVNEKIPIISTADSPHSMDILTLAGSSKVLQLHEILGRSLAGWTLGGECRANVIGRFDRIIIAEVPVMGTPLVGKTLVESGLRKNFGVTIVGIWERGNSRSRRPKRSSLPIAFFYWPGRKRAFPPTTRSIPSIIFANTQEIRFSSSEGDGSATASPKK
jgi:voltage-gated potassium channel